MYAVIKTGGKQYKVAAGEKIKVEQMPADIGAEITIDQVLAVGEGDRISVGTPLVAGATVSATVLSQGRHDKVRIFKMRRRKHYRKQQGHRQNYTELLVSGISSAIGNATAEGGSVAAEAGGIEAEAPAFAGGASGDQAGGVPITSGTQMTNEELGRVDPSLTTPVQE